MNLRWLNQLLLSFLLLSVSGCGSFFTNRDTGTNPPATGRFAFVANSNGGALGQGSISIFKVDATTGALTASGSVSTVVAGRPDGDGPVALVAAAAGKFLYSANDGGGVSGFNIDTNTGALTPISGTPIFSGVFPTAIAVRPNSDFLYVANSGSGDISSFRIDPNTGALTAVAAPLLLNSGAAIPAGLAMHPNGNFLYAAIDADGIAILKINTDGSLTLISTVPPMGAGRPQAIALEPTGNFAYIADGISAVEIFSINANTGLLTAVGTPVPTGNTPVALTLDVAGNFVFVANQASGNVSAFTRLATGGGLTPVAGSPFAAGTNPTAIQTDPTGKFVYVANLNGSPGVSIFSIDSTVPGKLNPAGGATAGANPAAIAFK